MTNNNFKKFVNFLNAMVSFGVTIFSLCCMLLGSTWVLASNVSLIFKCFGILISLTGLGVMFFNFIKNMGKGYIEYE